MSIYAFHLQGWQDLSTWGRDHDIYYAQLTRNDASDSDGTQIWITPPNYVVRSVTDLVHAIAGAIGHRPGLVDEAMRLGLALDRGDRVAPAQDGSCIERTLSRVTRPNQHLETW